MVGLAGPVGDAMATLINVQPLPRQENAGRAS
jgi:hypothetical protein